MRKKSTWLRQIVLLVVCAFTVSAYGQWRQFRNFTIKQNIKPPTNTILGVLGTSMGSRAQQSPYEHYSIPGLSDHKAVLAMSIQTDHLSKEIAALNRKNEDLKRKYESSMNNMAAKYEKAIKNLLKKIEERKKKLKEARMRDFQYRNKLICNGLEQGKKLRDTLYLIRLYNTALQFGLDSIATDCIIRFASCNPSAAMIAAADTIMNPNDHIAQILPAIFTEQEFFKYWINPDSSSITADDFSILAALCKKRDCDEFYINLARGMEHYLNNNLKDASDIFMRLSEHETEFTFFKPEQKKTLYSITTYMLDRAGRYTEMLAFFNNCENRLTTPPLKDEEQLGLLTTNNPYTTFMLYRAALVTGDTITATKYMNLCNTADAEYFEEQFNNFYKDVYAHFLDNPQYLENLDFIIAGFAPEYIAEHLNCLMSDLIRKLPDVPDDGAEHYYEENLTPYREAIIEIAHRADSIQNGQLTPQNAIAKMLAEISRVSFISSAQQGRENFKVLFGQLYKKRKDTNYHLPLVLTGVTYSSVLSYRQPKDAAAIIDKILPIMEIYDGVNQPLLCDTEYIVDTYKYAADLYRKINKKKKAEKMQKKAEQVHKAYE